MWLRIVTLVFLFLVMIIPAIFDGELKAEDRMPTGTEEGPGL